MALCQCDQNVIDEHGFTEKPNGIQCNFCSLLMGRAAFAQKTDVSKEEIKSEVKVQSPGRTPRTNHSVASSRSYVGLSNINAIISRMWIWISVQALFVGLFLGFSFSSSFNFMTFVLGSVVAFGAFAPLVFVIEAMREVVRSNLLNNPKD